jgi:3-oxoacyl-[acyl-carrier-protein] synthase II
MVVEDIREGRCECGIAVGSDSSVYEECVVRFNLLSALTIENDLLTRASRPFDVDRSGFVLGEGAAAMIICSSSFLEKHRLSPIARISGVGDATDNFHRTRSSPDGSAIAASMKAALFDAGLTPDQISHINAHGTSTPENDKMESLGIRIAFGAAATKPFVSSNKSMIGHTLTAAGVIEGVFSVLSLRDQVVPPNINCQNLDETLGITIATTEVKNAPVNHVLSNSFGFGGQNVSLVFSRL